MKTYCITFNHIALLIFIGGLSLLFVPKWGLLPFNFNCIILCSLLFILFVFYKSKNFKFIYLLKLLIIFFFSIMYFHCFALFYLNQAQQIENLPSQIETDFYISKILKQTNYQIVTVKAPLFLTDHQNTLLSIFQPRIYLNWNIKQPVQVGQKWHGTLQLKPISSRLNFYGFDRQKWYFSQRIIAKGKIKHAKLIKEELSWREKKLVQARKATQNLSMGGLLVALGFGERAWLAQDIWQIYQKSNTSHLIAISGLHISLAMLMGFLLVRGIQKFLPTNWIKPEIPLIMGFICACFYAWLAGFSLPTMRALLALLVFLLVKLNRYYCTPWQLFLWIVALILLIDPLAMLSSSFWLSFAAVLSLLVWYQFVPLSLFIYKDKSLLEGRWRYLWGILHLQIGLLWLFTPIQLLIFHGFSLVSLEANLIAVPFFSFLLVPCVLWATMTGGSFSSWQVANTLAEWIQQYLTPFSHHWIFLSIFQCYILSFCLLISFLIFVIFLEWRGRKRLIQEKQNPSITLGLKLYRKKVIWRFSQYYPLAPYKIKMLVCVMSSLLFFYVLSYLYIILWQPLWRLSMLDVGQGLAVLISKNQQAILYDTGVGWRGGSMAQLEIIPYLKYQGLKLKEIIISHDDNDHSGGVKDLLIDYPEVKLMQASYYDYQHGKQKIPPELCLKGKTWNWQGLQFKVLSPNKIVNRAKNEQSCVLLINDGKHKVLLMGDAGILVERTILPMLDNVDILQVGHHGSRTASGISFLQKIKPKIGLISVGRWNPWGLPSQKVLDRFSHINSQTYSTSKEGQIMLEFYPKKINIKQARTYFSPWYCALVGEKSKSEYNKPFFYL